MCCGTSCKDEQPLQPGVAASSGGAGQAEKTSTAMSLSEVTDRLLQAHMASMGADLPMEGVDTFVSHTTLQNQLLAVQQISSETMLSKSTEQFEAQKNLQDQLIAAMKNGAKVLSCKT